MISKIDLSAPDPGPRPEEELLTNEEVIAKYGSDLDDATIREEMLHEMVETRKLQISSGRKMTAEHAADEAWQLAYFKRFGTDEG